MTTRARSSSFVVVLFWIALTLGAVVIVDAQKPKAPATTVCPPADPNLDWVRALNALNSRIDQLEKKLDARPLIVHDTETEEVHRRLLGRPFPIYEGTIAGKVIRLTPK